MTSNGKRGSGDNSIKKNTPINPDEYKSLMDQLAFFNDVVKTAVSIIKKIAIKNRVMKYEINRAIFGKNNLQRGIALRKVKDLNCSVEREVEPFDKVLTAIKNGHDVDYAPYKSDALDICGDNFGSYIKSANQKLRPIIKKAEDEELDEK
jgi:hypothetical protein